MILTVGSFAELEDVIRCSGAEVRAASLEEATETVANDSGVTHVLLAWQDDATELLAEATLNRVPVSIVFDTVDGSILRDVVFRWRCIDQAVDRRSVDTVDISRLLGIESSRPDADESLLTIGSSFPMPSDPLLYEEYRYLSLVSPAMRDLIAGLRLSLLQMRRPSDGAALPPPWDAADGQPSAIQRAGDGSKRLDSRVDHPNLTDLLTVPEDPRVRDTFFKNTPDQDPRAGTGWNTLPPKLLILGESGTGKTLIAELVHSFLVDPAAPLMKVNCAGLGVGNFDHEMFGSAPGFWTGVGAVPGWLTRASYGVCLFDEIGDLPMETQARLLGFLDDLTLRPTGVAPFFSFLHVIAATNRDLDNRVSLRRFRHDLLARFTARVTVPPLRERGAAEVRHLIDFVAQNPAFNPVIESGERVVESVSDAAMQQLLRHEYRDGNFRELEEIVSSGLRRAQVGRDRVLRPEHLDIRPEPRFRPDTEELVVRVESVSVPTDISLVTVESESELRRVADMRHRPILDDGSGRIVVLDGSTLYTFGAGPDRPE